MYFVFVLSIGVCSLIAVMNKKTDYFLFNICFIIMTLMLCLRYGQGTDYFGYEYNYNLVINDYNIDWLLNNQVHGELGWDVLSITAKKIGLSSSAFIMILSFIAMFFIYKGLKRLSMYKMMALALFVPTYYLTYLYSGIRQGIVLAIVLGCLLELYIKDKKKTYIFSVFCCSLVHMYALVLLLPVIGVFTKIRKRQLVIVSSIVGVFIGIILCISKISISYIRFSPSIAGMIVRIFLFLIITKLYIYSSKDYINNKLYYFYFIGFCLFLMTASMGFVSTRLTAYMKVTEVILIPRLMYESFGIIYETKRLQIKRIAFLACVGLCLIEGTKNLESYTRQGEYKEGIHFYNYPYVSIFNKNEIYDYRDNSFNIKTNVQQE